MRCSHVASSLVYEVCKDGPKGIEVLLRLNHDCLLLLFARVHHGYPTIACLLNKSPTLRGVNLTMTAVIGLVGSQRTNFMLVMYIYTYLVSRVD